MQLFDHQEITQPDSVAPSRADPSGGRLALPALSRAQMDEVRRLLFEEYRLGRLVILENSGRALASLSRRQVGGSLAGQPITVLAGTGDCGAAGLVAARYLHGAGAEITVILSKPPEALNSIAAHQYQILLRAGITPLTQNMLSSVKLIPLLRDSRLVLDTLTGGGLQLAPIGPVAFLIQVAGQFAVTILSLDLPSGLSPDGDLPENPDLVIKAQATLALGLPRQAHIQPHAAQYTGLLYLADVGIPANLYARLGLTVPNLFSRSDTILLHRPKA